MTTERQRQIMRHALGLSYSGRGKPYRNHFCAGGKDISDCDSLVARGLMSRRVGSELSGGDPVYHVTESGRADALRGVKHRRPTKYKTWLRLSDAFPPDWKFGDWLKAGCPGWKEAKP